MNGGLFLPPLYFVLTISPVASSIVSAASPPARPYFARFRHCHHTLRHPLRADRQNHRVDGVVQIVFAVFVQTPTRAQKPP